MDLLRHLLTLCDLETGAIEITNYNYQKSI